MALLQKWDHGHTDREILESSETLETFQSQNRAEWVRYYSSQAISQLGVTLINCYKSGRGLEATRLCSFVETDDMRRV